MVEKKVNYPLASASWGGEELEAIDEVVKSGFFTMGKRVKAFEREFADYMGAKHAVMVNSGSSANLVGFQALLFKQNNPLKRGDKVIVPAVSWSTTYFPFQQCGLKLKFVDVDQRTFNLDLNQVEEAAKDPGVKAICAVNLLGRACDFDRLAAIAQKYELVILEDNCEGFGSSFRGKKAGTFGAVGTHSFFFSHHLVTMEGGMVVTDDEELYHNILCLRAHGWTRELPENSHLNIDTSDFTKKFRFALPGYNVRPLEIEASVGSIQLRKADDFIAVRRRNAELFYDLFSKISRVVLPDFDPGCSWFGYALMIEGISMQEREKLADSLMTSGIETRPVLSGNFLRNPVIKYMDHEVHSTLDVAEAIDDAGLFFGAQNTALDEEMSVAADVVKNFIDTL